jgi:hypothetical protein
MNICVICGWKHRTNYKTVKVFLILISGFADSLNNNLFIYWQKINRMTAGSVEKK